MPPGKKAATLYPIIPYSIQEFPGSGLLVVKDGFIFHLRDAEIPHRFSCIFCSICCIIHFYVDEGVCRCVGNGTELRRHWSCRVVD